MIAIAKRLPLALGVALLTGCPIPQPLPGVGNVDAGVAPPRILVDAVQPGGTFVAYETGACPDGGSPRFDARATVVDQTPDDIVEGRWFIDYDPDVPFRYTVIGSFTFTPLLPNQTSYAASFSFAPVADGWPGLPVHTLELVVSNGFDSTTPDGGQPNRTPRPGYETQLYRWVFQPVPGSGADGGCGP